MCFEGKGEGPKGKDRKEINCSLHQVHGLGRLGPWRGHEQRGLIICHKKLKV